MNRVVQNRRRFLKLVGASALTYPFLRGVPGYAAGNNGGTSANPVYLVLLFTANGCVRYRWGATGPAPTSLTPATTTAVTNGLMFRPTLSAFTKAGPSQQDLTKYVTVLDGLQNKAAGTGTHESGMGSLWTGLTNTGNAAVGPSIDQAIASQLSASTPYPTVALMVQSKADYQQRSVDTRMLYDLSGNFVDPFPTPAQAMAALFPTPTTAMAGPDKKTFIRQQAWNHINADLTSLQTRLCKEDRTQLQNLQQMWNQVLNQIQAAAMQAATCAVPSTDAGAGAGDGGASASCAADPFPTYAQIMPNILAMTLACNLTQVASLQYSHALSPVTHCWLDSTQTDTHHNYSHGGPSWIGALLPDFYSGTPPYYPPQLVTIETWYAQQVANLAYTFSQLQSGSGTLLDQSVICWGSELDMGAAHNHDDTPFVLIGGAGGQLKCTQNGGQLVRFPMNLPMYGAANDQCGIRFHNDLLVTLAQIMGVPTTGTKSLATAYGANWSQFQPYVNSAITDILVPA
jgi:hypothetical protein